MNIVTLPGFTAETSLYQTLEGYQVAGNFGQETGGVLPASCYSACVESDGCKFLPPQLKASCFASCKAECVGM